MRMRIVTWLLEGLEAALLLAVVAIIVARFQC
jgi:hypothetical protein